MYRSSLFLVAALAGTMIALVQPVAAAAKLASEVEAIARAVTVEIKLEKAGTVGSGVIVDKKGDLYTLVTNRHVVCGDQRCSKLPADESYSLGLADASSSTGQQYRIKSSSIKLLGNDLDLAIIQFRSNHNYAVAKVSTPGSLKIDDAVYTAGFPFEQTGFGIGEGKAIAVVDKRLVGDNGGYTIVYNAPTLPGMSGGGVFDGSGQLVAIHGYGDRFRENTEIDYQFRVDSKIGFNRGIPVRWLVANLADVGINLGIARSISGIRAARAQVPANADEYFIAGFNKFVEPGDNVVTGKLESIQEFSAAIRLNPRYQYAYFTRAYLYQQVKEFQQSLADLNQAITINPKYSEAYNDLANLKTDKLNDIQGALADYNQAIIFSPKYSAAYNNRAILKAGKLNDLQGALADFNQAIIINPKYSEAYYSRANLKAGKLNDLQGALADFNQAIIINPKLSLAYTNRANLKADELNNIQGALVDYNQAIFINQKDSNAYYGRANLKYTKLNDIQGALTDFNQAIIINPKYSEAYTNRAILKDTKLNDIQGALADFNQAIVINPKYSNAYYSRAILKDIKLNDTEGALADFNQAIIINPKYSLAYGARGFLKTYKLNDRTEAIQDFRQAARLFREQGDTRRLQLVIGALQDIGATE